MTKVKYDGSRGSRIVVSGVGEFQAHTETDVDESVVAQLVKLGCFTVMRERKPRIKETEVKK